MKNIIKINESQLNKILQKVILSEISQQTKAASYVKGGKYIDDLRKKKANGERTFSRNGRMFDIDNEIERKEKQRNNIGRGLARDLSLQNGGRPNDYSVHSTNNGDYSIETPNGHVYSNDSGNGMVYRDSKQSNVSRLGRLRDITDAMAGYDDEISGRMDKKLDGIKRRQRNVQALRDYDDAYSRWKQSDEVIKQSQNDYDRMSPLNPKKWFTKRPNNGPQAPIKPKWEPNEDGKFDGYFAHENPEDYDKEIDAVRNRQNSYRDAKNRYFKR